MRPEAHPGGAGAGRREVLPFAPPPEHAHEEEPIDPLRRELRPILRRLGAALEDLIVFVIRARAGSASTGETGGTPGGESGQVERPRRSASG